MKNKISNVITSTLFSAKLKLYLLPKIFHISYLLFYFLNNGFYHKYKKTKYNTLVEETSYMCVLFYNIANI
jgi:hypothetical protein